VRRKILLLGQLVDGGDVGRGWIGSGQPGSRRVTRFCTNVAI